MSSTVSIALLALAPALTSPQGTSAIPEERRACDDRLDGVLAHVDPALEGWSTEVLSSRAQELLGELARAALGEAPATAADLPAFVSAEVRTTQLRPSELETLRDGAELRVARGTISPESRVGRDALAEALNDLRAPQGQGGEPHVKVKVVRVAQHSAERLTTQGLFRLWTDREGGASQSDAIWLCEWGIEGEELVLREIQVSAYTESSSDGERFEDCSEAVLAGNRCWEEQLLRGTDDWCARIERGAGMNQYGHSGLCVGDFDADGLEDVYVLQGGGLPNRLFVQAADGSAEERAAELGIDWLDDSRAALLCDLDGDRRQELLVAASVGIALARRTEGGRYEVVRVLPNPGVYSLAAADADGDGLVDLYCCSYATSDTRSGLPAPYHDANNGPPNVFYRNLGGLEFEDATAAVGLDQNNERFSFAASWADYDGDGDPDLYVANDFGRNNLYRNDGGRFTDVAGEAGVEDISAGMGVSWGDYDGDGHLDVYVSNMFSSAGQRIAYQRRFKSTADQDTRQGFQRHARGNSLFRNNGDGTFSDVTVESNVWMGRWSWGAEFTDFDNDGREDIFVPNGFITNVETKDL